MLPISQWQSHRFRGLFAHCDAAVLFAMIRSSATHHISVEASTNPGVT